MHIGLSPRRHDAPYALTYIRMPPREWTAASYELQSAPRVAMGIDVINRLDLQGAERVLDAGCGTGRVTALLLERLPRGSVVAVDGAQALGDETRGGLG